MTAAVTNGAIRRYLEFFAQLESQARSPAERKLLSIRAAAIARFAERGFPTSRDEPWRHTKLAPLVEAGYALPDADVTRVTPAQIAPYRLGARAEALLVFVNGRFAAHLSACAGLPAGLRVMSLATALSRGEPVVRRHLARHAEFGDNPFAALNTALFQDGALVWVRRGAAVEAPIHLLYVTAAGRRPVVVQPRNLVVAEDDSRFQLVEQYVALGRGSYFNNGLTELVLGPGAAGGHCKLLRESDAACHVATVQLHQQAGSRAQVNCVSLGGALLRNEINALLAGQGARCGLHGLYLLDGARQAENHLRVEHASPRCASREFFRGILGGAARAVFRGRIVVRPAAQQTDARQTNLNLLLSDAARVDSQPQLEIRADDVKCTHAATIGPVDEQAVFYARSRGIGQAAARSMLVLAFARAGLAQLRVAALRRRLEQLVRRRLPQGELRPGEA